MNFSKKIGKNNNGGDDIDALSLLDEKALTPHQLLDNLPDLVFLLSRESVILNANNHPNLMAPRESIIGLTLKHVLPNDIAEQANTAIINALETSSPQHFDYSLSSDSGTCFYTAIVSPLTKDTVTAVCRDTTAEHHLRVQLAEQRDFLESIFASDVVAITVLSEAGELLYANAQAEHVLGLIVNQRKAGRLTYNDPAWAIESLDGSPFPDKDLPFARVKSTGQAVSDIRHAIVWPDGTRKVLSINGAPLSRGEAESQTFVFAIRDVTQEVQALREVKRLSRVASQTTNAVLLTDASGLVEWVNEGFVRMTGYSLDDIRGKKPGSLLQGSETNPETIQVMRDALSRKVPFMVDVVNYTREGQPHWVRINCNPLLNSKGVHQGYIAIQLDITKEKADAERIQQSERRLAAVIDGTRIGTWEWNVQSGNSVIDQRWAEILGYRLDELEPISIDTWMRLTHPDDLAESERLLNEHFSGKTKAYDCKARMRHKQGHWVWVHDRGRVFEWTPSGEPLLMLGTHADITQEVESQLALQASRDEFASLVANMPGVTYRCLPDDSWTILYISHQVDQVSGYTASELIDNAQVCYAELIHPDDAQRIDEEVKQAITSEQSWHTRYRIKHRNGNWCWVEERGHAIVGGAQHPVVLEGFLVDITREYEVQLQLDRHHEALTLLNKIAFNAKGNMNTRINYALEKARAFLEMDVAILSQIEGQVYTVGWISGPPDLAIQPGQRFELKQTWCQVLAKGQHAELFLNNVPNSDYRDHPCNQFFPLGAYAGIAMDVEGRIFGTLNFSSAVVRNKAFDDSEVMFVRLLTRWITSILEGSLSHERMNKLLAQLPGAVYQYRAYPDGRKVFPFSSPQIKALYGMSPEQAAADASPAFERIHPEDMDAVIASMEYSMENLETWNVTYRALTSDRGYRWVAGQGRPERLRDGSTLWHGYIQDVHEQEQGRRALERNEMRLRRLFDFSPIGIALNDFDTGQFLDLNEALIQPTGYNREEFVRLSYWELTPAEFQPEEEKALADLKAKGRYGPFEKEYIRKDGSRYPVRLQGMLSQDGDGRSVIWSLIEDITERKRIEQMKSDFISTVSHELRTPLTALSGALNLVVSGVSGELPDSTMSMLDIAQRNSQRLGLLINDLLDMEKLLSGKMTLNMVPQPLLGIINTTLLDNQSYADQFGVTFELVKPASNPSVTVDSNRLQQVLANLLSNAAKFSPEGETVTITVTPKPGTVSVSVKDDGPGIPASFRERLFQKFSQLDSSDRRSRSGTGLGLAISKELIEQMKGSIGVVSIEGEGSEFYFELPLSSPVASTKDNR